MVRVGPERSATVLRVEVGEEGDKLEGEWRSVVHDVRVGGGQLHPVVGVVQVGQLACKERSDLIRLSCSLIPPLPGSTVFAARLDTAEFSPMMMLLVLRITGCCAIFSKIFPLLNSAHTIPLKLLCFSSWDWWLVFCLKEKTMNQWSSLSTHLRALSAWL